MSEKKIFSNLQGSLIGIAEEMTGKKHDSRFKVWARTIQSVDEGGQNGGYFFKGDWINDGTIEMELKPRLFLVSFCHGSRRYTTQEYCVVMMNKDGELHPTEIMADSKKSGWALRICGRVITLLRAINESLPG